MTYYEVVEKIIEVYAKYTNTQAFVIESEIDLDRGAVYPIMQLVPADANFIGGTQTLNFDIEVLDRIDWSDIDKREQTTPGYRQDNLVDIIAESLVIHGRALGELSRGTDNTFQLEQSRPLNPITRGGKNELAGYSASVSIQVPNSDTEDGIC